MGKKEPQVVNPDRVETLIGKSSFFNGTIQAEGAVRVDGRIAGEVDCQGDLIVGEEGIVEANVKARNMVLAGRFRGGNIKATGKVEISATGKLEGDVETVRLIIEEGAVFLGNCRMGLDKQEENNEGFQWNTVGRDNPPEEEDSSFLPDPNQLD